MLKTCCLVLILGISLTGCATSSYKDASLLQSEQVLGDKIHAQILSTFHAYTEPRVNQYIQGVGEMITLHAKRQLPYRYTILQSEKIYATSSPGGYVYITTGMINYLDNEAELAAILAHEIAHLQFKELQATRGRKIAGVLIQGAAIGSVFLGPFAPVAALGVVATDVLVKNAIPDPAKKVTNADKKAMNYMVEAGYDPQSYLNIMKKFLYMDARFRPYIQDYQQSRPINDERLNKILKQFNQLDLLDKQLTTNPQTYQQATKVVRDVMYRV